jgi:hypothetical protein
MLVGVVEVFTILILHLRRVDLVEGVLGQQEVQQFQTMGVMELQILVEEVVVDLVRRL